MTPPRFLSAEWRHLVIVNYEVDPDVLLPLVPKGTEIDLWNGKAFISLLGFMFLNTKIKGWSIPFHRNFEEVNLRFYIKSKTHEGERRGVAFIKEIVPKWTIAFVARTLYNEKYVALPMQHRIEQQHDCLIAEYEWKFQGKWQKIGVQCKGAPLPIQKGTNAEFITEHYWGYCTQRDGETMAYQVQHPQWRVWETVHWEVVLDAKTLWPSTFSPFLEKPPTSAFLAEGSEVTVFKGEKIKQS